MYQEQIKEQNTLKAWATGKIVCTVLGIAVGLYLYNSGLMQKITSKLFKKESE